MERSSRLNSGHWVLPLCFWFLGQGIWQSQAQNPLPGAVGQQAVTDAQAQQTRERQAEQLGQAKEQEKPPVAATEVSEDLGSVQLMREVPEMPFARLRMDQTYSWLSNANYARNSPNVVAAWQAVSSIEAAWAPTISTMPGYEKFFPEAGFRGSFFNYFSQEEPSSSTDYSVNQNGLYDIGLVQDFFLGNLFFRGTRQVSDELSVGVSVDYNGYFYLNSQAAREESLGAGGAGASNFLNEYSLASFANYFHSFTDRHAVAVSWRAAYVLANPNYFTRSDNTLTGTYFVSLSDRISLSPFASYRLAYYTLGSSAPLSADFNSAGELTGFDNGFYRRLDQQYTLGLGLNFQLTPEVSTGLSFNYSKSDSTSRIAETGDFTNLTAGANWSMTYRFSNKEFVVNQPSECLGPYVRTDLGFGFINNLTSGQTLQGDMLPGVNGSLENPSISLNPGLRFDVAPGVNFTDWFGAEFSAGILYNGLDHLNGSGTVALAGGTETVGGGGLSLTGRYVQVPALISAVFRWPGTSRWKPYVSAGFGAAYSQLQINQIDNTETSDKSVEQFSPAFAVGSGFVWQVSDTVDFDVMYKLLGIVGPSYQSFQPGPVLSNAFQFGFNVRF